MAKIDSVPSLNEISRDKKSASVRQVYVPTNFTNFNPIWPRKKSAVLRQKVGSVRQPEENQRTVVKTLCWVVVLMPEKVVKLICKFCLTLAHVTD